MNEITNISGKDRVLWHDKEYQKIGEEALWNSFRVVGTDETINRSGQLVKIDGMEIDDYTRNPIVIRDHTREIEAIIGRTYKIEVVNNQLIFEGYFCPTEAGEYVSELYENGFLNAVSISYGVKKQKYEESHVVFHRAELREISFVCVGANPNALKITNNTSEDLLKLVNNNFITTDELKLLSNVDNSERPPKTKIKSEAENNKQKDNSNTHSKRLHSKDSSESSDRVGSNEERNDVYESKIDTVIKLLEDIKEELMINNEYLQEKFFENAISSTQVEVDTEEDNSLDDEEGTLTLSDTIIL